MLLKITSQTIVLSQIFLKKEILIVEKYIQGGIVMAITFNAKEARDMTDKAILNAEREERKKIEELLEKAALL